MISDEKGKQLHGRATSGEKLSGEEKAQLEEWYTFQDQLEMASFGLQKQESILDNLQAQIKEALDQLVKVSNHIQQITTENETLRQENITLRRQLAKLFGSPSV